MIRTYPSHTDGDLHEVEVLPRRDPVYPFDSAQTPDLYPREHKRVYSVERGRYTPKIGLRTAWTNLLTYSSTLANAAHTKTNLTATDNVAAHPRDGLSTLGTLIETVTNAEHKIGRAHTYTVASEHTLDIIARANGRDWLRLHSNDGTEDYEAWFNLTTGAWKYFADIINATTLNGGFETAGGGGADVFANWTESTSGTSTVNRDTSVVDAGTASCRLDIDGGGSDVSISQAVLVPGVRYKLAYRARASAAGSPLNATDLTAVHTPALTTSFAGYSTEFIATGTTLYFARSGLVSGVSVWIDSVVLTPLTRIPLLNPTTRNGGFETAGGGGADVFANWTESTSGASTVNRDTVVFDTGSASCRLDVDGSASDVSVSQVILIPGVTYLLRFRGRASAAGSPLTATDLTHAYTPALTTSFASYSTEFVATGTTLYFARSGVASVSVWIDNVTLTPLDLPEVSFTLLPFPAVAAYRAAITFLPRAAVGSIAFALSTDGTTLSYAGNTSLGIYAASLELKIAGEPGPVVETLGSTRTALCPDVDPDDCFAYLVAESAPAAVGIGDLQRVERTFARIPAQQLRYDYQSFARPNPSGLKSGSTYAARLGEPDDFHLWTARKTVLGYKNSQGTTSSNTLPSGNITITLTDATSCSFAANASKATIDAQLVTLVHSTNKLLAASSQVVSTSVMWCTFTNNALNSVRVSTISVPSGVEFAWVGNSVQFTGVGVTVYPDTKLINCPSHGAGIGEACAIWNGSRLLAVGTVAGVSDANSLAIVLSDFESPDFNITHMTFAAAASVRYAAGAREINVRIAEDFWFPGVTMLSNGTTMATLASLPSVTTYITAQGGLDRIVAGDTATAINASQIETYLGPIQSRKTVYALKDSTYLESLALT